MPCPRRQHRSIRLIGAEALTRSPGSDLTPGRWFMDADEVGLGVELELEVLRRSLAAAHQLLCAQDLGIHAAQGYVFGKPTADRSTWSEWHAFGPLVSVGAMAGTHSVASSSPYRTAAVCR